MITPIVRYLDELERLLKRVGKEATSKMVDEIHAHLLMSKRELVASGKSEDEAENLSLEQFGNANLVAADLIRQHTGVNTKSAWRLAAIPVALLILSMFLFVMGYFPGMRSPNWYLSSRVLQALSLVSYLVVVVRSRRWLLIPMTSALLALAVIGVCGGAWINSNLPSNANMKMVQLANIDQMQLLESELSYAQSAYRAVEQGQPVPFGAVYRATHSLPESKVPLVPMFSVQNSVYVVWGASLPFDRSEGVSLNPVHDGMDAAAVWKRDGARAIAGLAKRNDKVKEFASERQADLVGANLAATQLKRQIISSLIMALVNAFVLLLLNGLFLWLAALSDRLQRRRTVRSTS